MRICPSCAKKHTDINQELYCIECGKEMCVNCDREAYNCDACGETLCNECYNENKHNCCLEE